MTPRESGGKKKNGLIEWKQIDGKTLKDFETNEKTMKV